MDRKKLRLSRPFETALTICQIDTAYNARIQQSRCKNLNLALETVLMQNAQMTQQLFGVFRPDYHDSGCAVLPVYIEFKTNPLTAISTATHIKVTQ